MANRNNTSEQPSAPPASVSNTEELIKKLEEQITNCQEKMEAHMAINSDRVNRPTRRNSTASISSNEADNEIVRIISSHQNPIPAPRPPTPRTPTPAPRTISPP
ncbi:hypothetical protein PV327_011724, partial [Microctonus hyperodae]